MQNGLMRAAGPRESKEGVVVWPESDDRKGMVHFALDDAFKTIAAQKADEVDYLVRVSYVELYMERVNDLLREMGPASQNLPVADAAWSGATFVGVRGVGDLRRRDTLIVLHCGGPLPSIGRVVWSVQTPFGVASVLRR